MVFGGRIKKVAYLSAPIAESDRDLMESVTEQICNRLQRKKESLVLWRIRKNNLSKEYKEGRLSLHLILRQDESIPDVMAVIDGDINSQVWLCSIWDQHIVEQSLFIEDKFKINVDFRYL